jgi:protein required for attachment to host cells
MARITARDRLICVISKRRRLTYIDRMEHITIPPAALVLVSDGRRARFLRNTGTAAEPQLVLESALDSENPYTRDQGTDQPGRAHSPDGRSRSAMEETDWHQQAEDRFAAQVANLLYHMEHARKFDELVVVAPPKMLGDLRARLHREVAECVIAEVAKDLTGHPLPEIGRLLS